MKVGDLVRHRDTELECAELAVVVELIEKKCWRTSEMGKKINWDKIDPEPHAVVMYPDSMHNGPLRTIPAVDLVVIDEDR